MRSHACDDKKRIVFFEHKCKIPWVYEHILMHLSFHEISKTHRAPCRSAQKPGASRENSETWEPCWFEGGQIAANFVVNSGVRTVNRKNSLF